jgi:hypothetical protein
MSRIIINIEDGIDQDDAILLVKWVINAGRSSDDGGQYCYVTTWKTGHVVCSGKSKKGTDIFNVSLEKHA